MLYSTAGLLSLVVSLIVNQDIFIRVPGRDPSRAHRLYFGYLCAVMVYYVTDIIWGVLYERRMSEAIFIDTSVYWCAMACSVLLWSQFVVYYLKEENFFGRMLRIAGWLFFGFEAVMIITNLFIPVLFYLDEGGVYHAEYARYVTFFAQILMFVLTGVYVLAAAAGSEGTGRARYVTIGLSSITMAGFVIGQAVYPLLPLYSVGCMLGGCIIHSFVLESEKEEYTDKLEEQLKESVLKGNYYDLLTGLQGFTYFLKSADGKRKEMKAGGITPEILFLDLCGMKYYNQRHGFAGGDKMLKRFAELLTSLFGRESCCRIGQDRFIVVTEENTLADKVQALFTGWEKAIPEDCPGVRVGAYPDRSEDVDVILACDRAKVARDAIRNTFVSAVSYFDDEMLEKAERRQYIISHVDQAIEEQWIQDYYQPIVRAANGRVCDEEALARWIDPERGLMPPDSFIPILEEAGLIYKVDLYMLDRVIEKIRRTQEEGLYVVSQSVNLSRADFDSCDIVSEVCRRMDEAGLPHDLLSVEITESMVGSDFDFMKEQIDRLKALGFQVWMDDFGSGYSSLDLLADVHVDLIKLDMRFMQQFASSERSKVVLTELVRMAISLGIDTVCEGVEQKEQVEFLRDIGCAKLQGFYYTRPLPVEKIFERYRTGMQIGFENPEEVEYFESIGRINLYDLSEIAKDEKDEFRHYFSTIPMAVIEVRGEQARFTRANQAYSDFIRRTFHIELADLSGRFGETERGPGYPFVLMLRQCCKEGGRSVFDEKMPDGTTVHSFMRHIADDPVTDTRAAVVAVLAITKPDEAE